MEKSIENKQGDQSHVVQDTIKIISNNIMRNNHISPDPGRVYF
jgi:hypothetical protein